MGMTIKETRLWLAKENAKWPETLVAIPREKWPNPLPDETETRVAVWRSKDFLVQEFAETAEPAFMRLTVNRTMIDRHGNWVEGITWDELQRLKAEAGYGAWWAVELYPASGTVVNVANMRHLWLLQSQPEFAW